MTEPDPPPAVEVVPAAPEPPPAPSPSPRPRRDLLPWLCGLGFVILAAAIGYVWQDRVPPAAVPAAAPATDDRLAPQVAALEARIARLEQRPAAAASGGPDLAPITARIKALEKRLADTDQLGGRLNALSARLDAAPAGDSGGVDKLARRADADEGRLAALEKRAADNGQLIARLDALSGRVDALSGRDQSAAGDLGRRVDADETRLATLERNAGPLAATLDRAVRLARIAAAQGALTAGRPLGDLPGAPAAVARFASTAPPTAAALRLAFPQAAKAALAVRAPDSAGQPFLTRAFSRAEELVTVRRGDHVLIGDPAAGVIARAETMLDAGDLAAAVAAVSSLTSPQAAVMAPWLADARALLDARSGLADMAARG